MLFGKHASYFKYFPSHIRFNQPLSLNQRLPSAITQVRLMHDQVHIQPSFINPKCLFYDTSSNMPWNFKCYSDIFYSLWWFAKLVFNSMLKNLILTWWPINEIIPMDIFLLVHTLIIGGMTHFWTDNWPATHQFQCTNFVMICILCASRCISIFHHQSKLNGFIFVWPPIISHWLIFSHGLFKSLPVTWRAFRHLYDHLAQKGFELKIVWWAIRWTLITRPVQFCPPPFKDTNCSYLIQWCRGDICPDGAGPSEDAVLMTSKTWFTCYL